MPVRFDDAGQAADFLKQVAAQSYGSGRFEGDKGGFGSIGMIGGKPVKFNTHWKDSFGKATSEMINSSNALRESLWAAAKALSTRGSSFDGEWLSDVRRQLGLDPNGSAADNKTLLSRKVAAQVLGTIDGMRNEFIDKGDKLKTFFEDAKAQAKSSKGVDTKFATLAAAAEKDAMIARYTSGNLTPEDIKALNDDPTGTPCQVTLKYPDDLDELQQDFNERYAKAGNSNRTGGQLDGLGSHFNRSYTYVIGGTRMEITQDCSETERKKRQGAMENAFRELFDGQSELLHVLDEVFKSRISAMGNHLLSKTGVRLGPAMDGVAEHKESSLSVAKNPDGSFRVSLVRLAKNLGVFTHIDESENTITYTLKPDVKGEASFCEYSLEFDLKMQDGKPIVTGRSDPTLKYQMSADAYSKGDILRGA